MLERNLWSYTHVLLVSQGRLLDNDDKVRSAKSHSSPTSPYLISLSTERLCGEKRRQLFKDKKEDDPQEIGRIMSKILMHCETQLLKCEALVTPGDKPEMCREGLSYYKHNSSYI